DHRYRKSLHAKADRSEVNYDHQGQPDHHVPDMQLRQSANADPNGHPQANTRSKTNRLPRGSLSVSSCQTPDAKASNPGRIVLRRQVLSLLRRQDLIDIIALNLGLLGETDHRLRKFQAVCLWLASRVHNFVSRNSYLSHRRRIEHEQIV
ncbi:MAG: hypothetical protein WCC66_10510, partial [Rhizobiaceae bacterium]